MRILVLSGGTSNERDVSLRSGNAVSEALRAAGHEVRMADPGASDFDLSVVTKGMDAAFIALHGAGGEDGSIQKRLESAGLPYTGNGVEASELCWDKWAYKEFLKDKGIPLSAGKLLTAADADDPLLREPFVLKPIRGGSTLDALIVRHVSPELTSQTAALLQKYDCMLVEPLIVGTEITVPIVGDETLPVIEIIPPPDKEFDYENKYNGATQELCPPKNVPEPLQKEAQVLALKIHKLTGCRDMSRTDMMIDKSGKLHVLETNTIPGLTLTSLLPKSAAVAGMDMPALCDKLINLALKH